MTQPKIEDSSPLIERRQYLTAKITVIATIIAIITIIKMSSSISDGKSHTLEAITARLSGNTQSKLGACKKCGHGNNRLQHNPLPSVGWHWHWRWHWGFYSSVFQRCYTFIFILVFVVVFSCIIEDVAHCGMAAMASKAIFQSHTCTLGCILQNSVP